MFTYRNRSLKSRLILLAVSLTLGLGAARYKQAALTRRVLAQTPANYIAPAELPPLGPAQPLDGGILWHQVKLERADITSKLWVYLPEHPAAKLPCVFIAPAGSRLFHGMTLGEGDQPEQLPYVRAGYAVVAYELDGPLPDQPRNDDIYVAAEAFKSAEGGLDNARTAIDYAFARIPNLDRDRIYTAGHSSAATVSLLVAEREPRVKACIAYAPAPDLEARIGTRAISALARIIPGYQEFIAWASPKHHTELLKCPTFLFHADDDGNVPTQQVATFATALQQTNKQVTFVRVPTGGHYDSMRYQGIPAAIEWLKKLGAG